MSHDPPASADNRLRRFSTNRQSQGPSAAPQEDTGKGLLRRKLAFTIRRKAACGRAAGEGGLPAWGLWSEDCPRHSSAHHPRRFPSRTGSSAAHRLPRLGDRWLRQPVVARAASPILPVAASGGRDRHVAPISGARRCAVSVLLRRISPKLVSFYALTKCPPRRANPWYKTCVNIPAPPKVTIHNMAPWEQPPPWFGP